MYLLGAKLLASRPLPGAEVFTPGLHKFFRDSCGLRRADRYTALAVAASLRLAEECALPPPWNDATALLTATAFGPHRTTFATLDDILDYPEDQILPTRFSHSVHNAAASYVSTVLGLKGAVFALNGFENVLYETLQLAETMLSGGLARRVLVLGVEENALLTEQVPRFYPERFRDGADEGALALLLSADPADNRRGQLIMMLENDRRVTDKMFYFGGDSAVWQALAEAGPDSVTEWR